MPVKGNFGRRSGPDPRADLFPKFKASLIDKLRAGTHTLPSRVSYRDGNQFPFIYDQGPYGDCVANASAELDEFFLLKRKKQSVNMSRRAIYAQAKHAYEPDDIADDGLYVSDGLLVLESFGYVPEASWPYPSMTTTDDALLLEPVPSNLWVASFEPKSHSMVECTVEQMKLALFEHGPLIIGLEWPDEWMSAPANGLLDLHPKTDDGGHCVIIDDYNDNRFGGSFEIRNSWGPTWADGGYGYLSYSLVGNTFWPDQAFTVTVPT